MKRIKIITLGFVFILLVVGKVFGQMPAIVEKGGRHALLVDSKPFFMLGGQAHNSSGWPGMQPHLWQAVGAMHLNTLEVPICWEQVEAEPGHFDF